MNQIESSIARLERALLAVRPEFFQTLNPGLSAMEIDRLASEHNAFLPADLRALYQWRNGQSDHGEDVFADNWLFATLEAALDTNAVLTPMIGSDFDVDNWWHSCWIPIFWNGGGDSLCYDTSGQFTGQKGQLIEFWHADNDRNVVAPSLAAYLDSISEYLETEIPSEDEEYFEPLPIAGYPLKFIVS